MLPSKSNQGRFFSQQERPLITELFWLYDFQNINTSEALLNFLQSHTHGASLEKLEGKFLLVITEKNHEDSIGLAKVLNEIAKYARRQDPNAKNLQSLVNEHITQPIFTGIRDQFKDTGATDLFKKMCGQILKMDSNGTVKNKLLIQLWQMVVEPCVENGQAPTIADVFTKCVYDAINFYNGRYGYEPNCETKDYFLHDALVLIKSLPGFQEYIFLRGPFSNTRFNQLFLPHIYEGLLSPKIKRHLASRPEVILSSTDLSTALNNDSYPILLGLFTQMFDPRNPRAKNVASKLIGNALNQFVNSRWRDEQPSPLEQIHRVLNLFLEDKHTILIPTFIDSLTTSRYDSPDPYRAIKNSPHADALLWFLASYLIEIPANQLGQYEQLQMMASAYPRFNEILRLMNERYSAANGTMIQALLSQERSSFSIFNFILGAAQRTRNVTLSTSSTQSLPNPLNVQIGQIHSEERPIVEVLNEQPHSSDSLTVLPEARKVESIRNEDTVPAFPTNSSSERISNLLSTHGFLPNPNAMDHSTQNFETDNNSNAAIPYAKKR